MSDTQNHNDPLERLFKKKAEEYDIPFNEGDWDSLDQKLELQDAKLAYRRKASLLAAASFLIISLLGYYTLQNHNRLNQLNQQLSEESIRNIPPLFDNQTPGNDSTEDAIEQGEEDQTERVAPNQSSSDIVAVQNRDEINKQSDFERSLASVQSISFDDFSNYSKPEPPSSAFNKVNFSTNPPSDFTESEVIASSSSEAESNSQTRSFSRLSVGLVAAPDMSTVGSLSNFENAGYKLGATVEYSLSEHLSVSAGLIHTKVIYSAQSNQYRTPFYFYDGASPEQVFAECLLFDIPITIKFNFKNFDRSRFFATAGLSSYIMQEEDYRFSYGEYSQGEIAGWSGRTGTQHWFSNAGFSIGYEQDIHAKWSLRVEPFIKVPILEIGWGNVKLYSLGSFVSVNYRL